MRLNFGIANGYNNLSNLKNLKKNISFQKSAYACTYATAPQKSNVSKPPIAESKTSKTQVTGNKALKSSTIDESIDRMMTGNGRLYSNNTKEYFIDIKNGISITRGHVPVYSLRLDYPHNLYDVCINGDLSKGKRSVMFDSVINNPNDLSKVDVSKLKPYSNVRTYLGNDCTKTYQSINLIDKSKKDNEDCISSYQEMIFRYGKSNNDMVRITLNDLSNYDGEISSRSSSFDDTKFEGIIIEGLSSSSSVKNKYVFSLSSGWSKVDKKYDRKHRLVKEEQVELTQEDKTELKKILDEYIKFITNTNFKVDCLISDIDKIVNTIKAHPVGIETKSKPPIHIISG